MEEVPRGEFGYREWCLHLVELGHCTCDGCGGHLADGTCEACGCGHRVQEPTRHDRQLYTAWIPYPYPGRCAAADAYREAERREHERLERQRAGER